VDRLKAEAHFYRVQYKKVASLMIISLAIEHTDLMSNVEQGMSNYEVLFLFGNTYACYKNRDQLIIFIYQYVKFSAPSVRT
jgi:hypothetical protein